MQNNSIQNWSDVLCYLKERDFNDQAFTDLLIEHNLENTSLGDLTVTIEGNEYDGSFRSDFSKAIEDVQKEVWFIASLLLSDTNEPVNLNRAEKEALTIRLEVIKGCSKFTFFNTKAIAKAIAKRISRMSPAEFSKLCLWALVIIYAPSYFDSLYPYFETIRQGEGQEKIAELQKIAGELKIENLELKAKVREIALSRDRMDESIVQNSFGVSSIKINDTVYSLTAIDNIRHPTKLITEQLGERKKYQVYYVNRKNAPLLKVRLKDLETGEEFTASLDISCDAESDPIFSQDQLLALRDSSWEEKPIELSVSKTRFSDGKFRSAVINDIYVPD